MGTKTPTSLQEIASINKRFYDALESQDLEEMVEIWSHGDEARCVHPGWDALAGWEAIRASWEAIFASSANLSVEPQEVELFQNGSMAWVHCLELIRQGGEEAEDRTQFARATNLYVKTEEGWKMILHHASGVPDPRLAETGLVH